MKLMKPKLEKWASSCEDQSGSDGNVAGLVEDAHVTDANGEDVPRPVAHADEGVVEEGEEHGSLQAQNQSSAHLYKIVKIFQ